MKSSVCGFLPSWTRTSGPKCDSTSKSVKSRSSVDPGNMTEIMYGNQPLPLQQKSQLYHKKSKVSPLLRLDSQGEIANNSRKFCDNSVNIQPFNNLRLSNSFDSYSLQDSNANFEFENNTGKNRIPHRSFHKSNSIPANLRMPAHQSFPPPASSFGAIRSNSFCCPATNSLSPFSSSPRNLGHVDVFGGNQNSNPDHQHCSVSFTFDSSDVMKRTKNIGADKLNNNNCSEVSGEESKVKFNNCGMGTMTSMKTDRMEKVPIFDHSIKETASASPVNCVDSVNDSAQDSFTCSSSSTYSSSNSVNCSKDKDLSYILFVRKPKKRRARNRRKNRHQNQDIDNQPFMPSSCSSPIKNDSKVPSPSASSPIHGNNSASKCHASACEVPTLSPSKSCSSFILFASADSDHSTEQLSDDEFDSIVFSDDSTSPPTKCGKKRKYKQKQSQKQEKSSGAENVFDLESDNEQMNSSLSGLRFTFVSLSVSEDEDNDSSVDWGELSSSPCASDPQLIFEFEFNTGLSLEAIIGQDTTTDCPALSKELREVNMKWNKLYASSSFDKDNVQHHQKVRFAGDEDLVTVHIVGDEDRGGEWHHYATERARFQRKIKDIETVIAPVLCASHRAKVFERMGVKA